MYNIMYETSRQSRFYARNWIRGAGALGQPRGRVWGGRREEVQDGEQRYTVVDSFRYLTKLIKYCTVKKKKKDLTRELQSR